MRLSQTDLAELLDVSRAAVSQATKKGHKVDGYPVRAWAVFDGAGRVSGYDVPKRVFERSNPSTDTEAQAPNLVPDVASQAADILGVDPVGRTWPDAAAETGAPVSANVGASAVGWKAMDVVHENPPLMVDVVDALVTLGGGGIVAFATDESTPLRPLWVIGGMAGTFAVFKALRGLGDSQSRGRQGQPSLGESQRQPEGLNGPSEQDALPEATNGSRTRENGRSNTRSLGTDHNY